MERNNKCILFIGNHLSQSGQNLGVGEELSVHLIQNGWQTILVSKKLEKIPRLFDMLWTIFYRRKSYFIAQVDVFSGPAFLWAFLSVGLLKIIGKPVILTLHGGALPEYASNHPHRVQCLLDWADNVTSPSPYLQQKLVSYRADIHVIPNGLEAAKYGLRFRGKYPQAKLVWLRAFHQIYNPTLVPEIIKILKNHKIDCHLLMVGPDKGDGSLQNVLRLAQELEVTDMIKIVEGVSKKQVPEMLLQGDIFLNTSNFDNSPVSVIEAMASGCCIVTTNVGGIPYLLKDNVDALLVPPNNPITMAEAVKRVLTEPGLAHKLSINARKEAEQFDWSVVVPQWEILFADTIQKVKS